MKTSFRMMTGALAVTALTAFSQTAAADNGRAVGEVDTAVKIVGPNHKIKIVAFEDPDVPGVTCFVSRAVKGGVSGYIGVAEDTADASVACRQTGPITSVKAAATNADPKGVEVFSEKRSVLFKELHVTRHFDKPTGCWTYLTWTDKLIDGSAKNSLSAVCPQAMQAAPH